MEKITKNDVLDLLKIEKFKELQPKNHNFGKFRKRSDTQKLKETFNECLTEIRSAKFEDTLKKACKFSEGLEKGESEAVGDRFLDAKIAQMTAEMQSNYNDKKIEISSLQKDYIESGKKLKTSKRNLKSANQQLEEKIETLNRHLKTRGCTTNEDVKKTFNEATALKDKIDDLDREIDSLNKSIPKSKNQCANLLDNFKKTMTLRSHYKKEAKAQAANYGIYTMKTLYNAVWNTGKGTGMIGSLLTVSEFFDESVKSVIGKRTSETRKHIDLLKKENCDHGFENSRQKIIKAAEAADKAADVASELNKEQLDNFMKKLAACSITTKENVEKMISGLTQNFNIRSIKQIIKQADDIAKNAKKDSDNAVNEMITEVGKLYNDELRQKLETLSAIYHAKEIFDMDVDLTQIRHVSGAATGKEELKPEDFSLAKGLALGGSATVLASLAAGGASVAALLAIMAVIENPFGFILMLFFWPIIIAAMATLAGIAAISVAGAVVGVGMLTMALIDYSVEKKPSKLTIDEINRSANAKNERKLRAEERKKEKEEKEKKEKEEEEKR